MCHLRNFRKEEAKFNVWLAYLNLENTYGEPPEEAALALFQRAVQACTQVLEPLPTLCWGPAPAFVHSIHIVTLVSCC